MKQILTVIVIALQVYGTAAGGASSVKADIERETRPIKLEIEAIRKRIDVLEARGK